MAENFYVEKVKDNKSHTVAKHNWAWFLGVFILILISASFILPSTGFARADGGKVYFGRYGKRKIEYGIYPTQTIYARAAENYHQYYSSMFSSDSSSMQTMIRNMAYSAAFDAVVERYAILDITYKSSFYISKAEAEEFILKNFVDDSGKFASAYWKTLTKDQKNQIINDSKDDIAVEHFKSDYSKIKKNEANTKFVVDYIGEIRNFSCLVFKGDDAQDNADNALYSLTDNSGTLSSVKADDQEIVNIENVYKDYEPDTFYPVRDSSETANFFYNKLDEDDEFKQAIFDLDLNGVYPKVVDIDDKTKMLVSFTSFQTTEQESIVKDNVDSRINYSDDNDFTNRIHASSLFKNNYTKGYNKLFPSSDS